MTPAVSVAAAPVVPADEEFWEDLLGHLQQRVLVPVVGPELLVLPDAGRRLTLSRALAERLAARYGVAPAFGERGGLDEAVQAILAARGAAEGERLYRVVNDLLAALAPAPPPALQRLAEIDDIPLYLSTTFDSLLAQAVDAARFGGAHGVRELWFSPNQSTADQQRNAAPPAPGEVTVFKLFGRGSSTPQYALHDEDVLEWLHALVAETARLPEWLAHELKENPLLFVGCQTPEWAGRLLLRLGSRTRLSLAPKQFFLVGSGVSLPAPLTAFLRTYCGTTRVQVLDADPAAFAVELHRRWRARRPPAADAAAAEQPAPGPAPGGIFISYVREDAAAARRVQAAVAGLGGDVWLDERRLQPGDRWEEEILGAIRRQVRLFLPIVSRQTEAREEGYVFKEWHEAVERARGIPRRRFILPVVVDPDYDGDPRGYRQVPEEFRELHFGRAPGGEPSPELLDALRQEIRAMRRGGAP